MWEFQSIIYNFLFANVVSSPLERHEDDGINPSKIRQNGGPCADDTWKSARNLVYVHE